MIDWGVEPLAFGPTGNSGYLSIRPPRLVAVHTPDISRRVCILDELMQRDMTRPEHNIA